MTLVAPCILFIFVPFLIYHVAFVSHAQVPRESLLFVIPAFGGSVSWDGEGAPFKETDQNITHQVIFFCCEGNVHWVRFCKIEICKNKPSLKT